MKVSIITACYNSEKYLEHCMRSVLTQDYRDIEYILVDGQSKDRTLEIIKRVQSEYSTRAGFKVISEKDVNLYDAMNKGLRLATGDVVGILNSDDFYKSPTVLSQVVAKFNESGCPIVIGDLEFVDPIDTEKVSRCLSAKNFKISKFLYGDAPPHPTFFVKRELYKKHGLFNINYRVCADFDLMLRFMFVGQETWAYLPGTLISMRTGGVSNRSWLDKFRFRLQKLKICRSHGLETNIFKVSWGLFLRALGLVAHLLVFSKRSGATGLPGESTRLP